MTLDKVLMVLGAATILLGYLWMLFVAFEVNQIWGLACTFVPILSVLFGLKYWSKGAKPLLMMAGGFVCGLLGFILRVQTT